MSLVINCFWSHQFLFLAYVVLYEYGVLTIGPFLRIIELVDLFFQFIIFLAQEGTSHDRGLYARCFEELFDLANSDSTSTSRFNFLVTVCELYNEQVLFLSKFHFSIAL